MNRRWVVDVQLPLLITRVFGDYHSSNLEIFDGGYSLLDLMVAITFEGLVGALDNNCAAWNCVKLMNMIAAAWPHSICRILQESERR